MKKIKSIAMMAVLVLAAATFSFGQTTGKEQNQPSGGRTMGPHQGIMQEAKPYFIEVVRAEKVLVYLLESNAKPKGNSGVSGNAILTFPDNTSVTVDLTPYGDDGFIINNNEARRFVSCEVTFKENGATITSKFNFFTK